MVFMVAVGCGETGGDEQVSAPAPAPASGDPCGPDGASLTDPAMLSAARQAWLDHEGRSGLDEGEQVALHHCADDQGWASVRTQANTVALVLVRDEHWQVSEVLAVEQACGDERVPAGLVSFLGC